MKRILVSLMALLASPLQAQQTHSTSVASAFVEVANAACLAEARGTLALGRSPEQDESVIKGLGLTYGIGGRNYDRFGAASSMLNRAIMGSRAVGDDLIVLATGGASPECKVFLLQPKAEGLRDSIAVALTVSTPKWRELPFTQSQLGLQVTKQSFISRDAAGTPFLLNLIFIPQRSDSEVRVMIGITQVPAHVAIPEGY